MAMVTIQLTGNPVLKVEPTEQLVVPPPEVPEILWSCRWCYFRNIH